MIARDGKIRETLAEPDFAVQSVSDDSFQYGKRYDATPVTKKIMLVIVKHLNSDGFVITTFFVNRIRVVGKRVIYGEEAFDQL